MIVSSLPSPLPHLPLLNTYYFWAMKEPGSLTRKIGACWPLLRCGIYLV